MKLYIEVDQRGSIAAEYVAPNSSEIIDLPVSEIPEDTRGIVGENYDPANSRFRLSINGRYIGLRMSHPLTTERVVESIQSTIERGAEYLRNREVERAAETAREQAKKSERDR